KVLRVIGLSSSVPYNPTTEPLDPINRRISIIVMNKKTEQEVLQTMGDKANTETAAPESTPEPAKK
ncbi:MAG: flagellar motor protein MotB, partial [Methylobacter sp.]